MWKKPRNRRVSGITFIRYAQDHKIGKPNNFKVFVSNKTKGHKIKLFYLILEVTAMGIKTISVSRE
jgi:hypothetical protein